ncbi:MAG: recombination mediator RecR [Bdellovibrionota bacterium]|nr:recombination mediator RecR [Bdellovibrionota bacterium]
MKLPEKILNASEMFSKVPGIGEKSALRNVINMTKWNKDDLLAFSDAIREMASIKNCAECGAFSDDELCSICTDVHRDGSGQICVVETITDCLAIERSGEYRGLYHILGGVLNPLMGVGPESLRLDKLARRIDEKSITNVILAISPSVEGDVTCNYINELLSDDIEVTRIGFGIPMGGNLEYLDSMTISKALENKKRM